MISYGPEARFLGSLVPAKDNGGCAVMQDIGVCSKTLTILHRYPLSFHKPEIMAKGVVLR